MIKFDRGYVVRSTSGDGFVRADREDGESEFTSFIDDAQVFTSLNDLLNLKIRYHLNDDYALIPIVETRKLGETVRL